MPVKQTKVKYELIHVCLLLLIILLAASSSILLGASYLPYGLVKTTIDTLDNVDGNAVAFTTSLFERIVVKFRVIGLMLILITGMLYIGRRRAEQHAFNMMTSILISLSSASKELQYHFNKAIREDDKIHLCGLLIILLLAVVIRLYFLFQPMRTDEATTFLAYASKPLFIGLSNYATPNNHLFHTLLVHIAYLFLGNEPWILRLPALLAGILLVPLSYIVTRIIYNKYAALLATSFVASSPILIDFSTNARGYTLICSIFLLILTLGTYLVRTRNSAIWLLFTISSALGFYTIPIMLYPFGVVFIWLFLSIISQGTKLRRSLLLKDLFICLIVTALLTFMLYVPVLAITGLQSVVGNQFVLRKREVFLASFPPSIYSVWNTWNGDLPTIIKFLLVAGFFTSLIFHRRLTNYRVPIILALVIWIIPLLIVQRVVPFERVWLFLLPLYLAFASAGVSYLLGPFESKMSRHKSIVFTMVAVTLSFWLSWNIVHTQPVYYSREIGIFTDAEPITIFLKNYLKPEDKVLAVGPSFYPLLYYFYLHHVPTSYLRLEYDSSQRIFLIANESNGETLRGILDEGKILDTNSMSPKVIQRYNSATLYEISRGQ